MDGASRRQIVPYLPSGEADDGVKKHRGRHGLTAGVDPHSPQSMHVGHCACV
jgi:hypothetical protein